MEAAQRYGREGAGAPACAAEADRGYRIVDREAVVNDDLLILRIEALARVERTGMTEMSFGPGAWLESLAPSWREAELQLRQALERLWDRVTLTLVIDSGAIQTRIGVAGRM